MAFQGILREMNPRMAGGILVNVIGDDALTLAEAEYIARYIKDHVHQDTRLIWGAAINKHLKNRIQVFILMGVPWRYVFY